MSELEKEILSHLSYTEWKNSDYIKNRINPNEYNLGLMNCNFYTCLIGLEVKGLIKSRKALVKEYIKTSGGEKEVVGNQFDYVMGGV